MEWRMRDRPALLARLGHALGLFSVLTLGLASHAVRHVGELRRWPIERVFRRQVFFTGIQAILPVSVAALALGFGLEAQLRCLLGSGIEPNV